MSAPQVTLCLLSNAEGAEDQVKDVVAGRGTRDLVERPQRVVQIEEQHFVGDFSFDCDSGITESRN